jgi:endonuclease/exonuclease/phosphatase family metal-dependent hydrolase
VKRIFYRAAVCSAVLLAWVPLGEARPLRVLTYNIHHAEGRDGVWDLNRIASIINGAQPDLVALQELDQGTERSGANVLQLNQLAGLTGMNGYFGKTINYQGGEYGNGVLVNPDFTVVTLANRALPSPNGGEARRVMELRIEFADDNETRQFDFFATHLDHSNAGNRSAQIAFINDRVDESNRPALMGGHFNLRDTSAEYSQLLDEWIDPTVASPGITQIDYVFYRGADQWSTVQRTQPIINATTQQASDHYPWLAVLELKPYDADFDNDADVDGADLLAWQRRVGTGGVSTADANSDRVVDGLDLDVWRSQFTTVAATNVPEPNMLTLLTSAFAMTVLSTVATRRRRCSWRRLFVLVLLGVVANPLSAEARPLRVLTYNIHHCQGRDGVYDLQRIADVINAAQPDLVSLQEVHQGTSRVGGDLQFEALVQLTGMSGRFGKAMNSNGGQVGNVVLFNPEFEFLRAINHAMPDPDDSLDRAVLEVRLRIDDAGQSRRIDFFATHFDHASGANRNAQMTFVNDLVAESHTPAILAGDFNFQNDTPAYNKLTRQWVDPTATNPGRATQIDYVTYRASDQWAVTAPGRFIVNSTTADASDHYPLLAVLDLLPHTADFDKDADVDGADFLHWQRSVGATGINKAGDANRDHAVDAGDLAVWQTQAGLTVAATAVPEPAGWMIAAAAAVASALNAKRGERLRTTPGRR